MKIPFCQYRKSYCGVRTVIRSSHLHSGLFSNGKIASSLNWVPRCYLPAARVDLYSYAWNHQQGKFQISENKKWWNMKKTPKELWNIYLVFLFCIKSSWSLFFHAALIVRVFAIYALAKCVRSNGVMPDFLMSGPPPTNHTHTPCSKPVTSLNSFNWNMMLRFHVTAASHPDPLNTNTGACRSPGPC